ARSSAGARGARSSSQSQSQSQSSSPARGDPSDAAGGPAQGTRGQGSPERGAGASHAWIEAYTPTHGWRGFDPTNNLVASEHHIKIAVGRDYRDVPPTRGTYRGDTEESLTVEVDAVPLG